MLTEEYLRHLEERFSQLEDTQYRRKLTIEQAEEMQYLLKLLKSYYGETNEND